MSPKKYRTRLNQLRLELAAFKGGAISYQEIADKTGLSYPTVHRYATKVIERPDFETIRALAAYFGVKIEDLVYEVSGESDEKDYAPA